MRALRGTALGIGLLLWAGCHPRLEVTLASGDERLASPRFLVEDHDHADRPRYDTVQVVDGTGIPYWHLRAEPYGDLNSVAQVSYGVAPMGFTVLQEPRALERGHVYVLFVVGKNRGSLRFEVDAGGGVHALPP